MRRISIDMHSKIQNVLQYIACIIYAIAIVLAFILMIASSIIDTSKYFWISIICAISACILETIAYRYHDWIMDQRIIYYHCENEFVIKEKKGNGKD